MKKIGKILTFIGIAGAALAGLWYFLDNVKKDDYEDEVDENEEDDEEVSERSYVSLDTSDEKSDREALEDAIKSVVSESIAKAEEEADGVGLVKGDNEASDFEFESFDKE